MRVDEHLQRSNRRPIISFEFSRPKSEEAAANLDKALAKLKALDPDYVSVTFGAGGSTRDGSIQLVDKLKNEFGFEVVAYIAGVGLAPDQLCEVLDRYRDLGIETMFVVRGDAPTWDDSYEPHPEAFSHASDMGPPDILRGTRRRRAERWISTTSSSRWTTAPGTSWPSTSTTTATSSVFSTGAETRESRCL